MDKFKDFNVWDYQEFLYSEMLSYNSIVSANGVECQEAQAIREEVDTIADMLHDSGVKITVLHLPDCTGYLGICVNGRYKPLRHARRTFFYKNRYRNTV